MNNQQINKNPYPRSTLKASILSTKSASDALFVTLMVLAVTTGAAGLLAVTHGVDWQALRGLTLILVGVRFLSVILVEVFYGVVEWKEHQAQIRVEQKGHARHVRNTWIVFSALNLVIGAAMETNYLATLSGSWIMVPVNIWLHVGLPASGLVMGVLISKFLKANPDHRRAVEVLERAEAREQADFELDEALTTAETTIMTGNVLKEVAARAGWRNVWNKLKATNQFDENELAYIFANVPELKMPDVAEEKPQPTVQVEEANRYFYFSPVTGYRVGFMTLDLAVRGAKREMSSGDRIVIYDELSPVWLIRRDGDVYRSGAYGSDEDRPEPMTLEEMFAQFMEFPADLPAVSVGLENIYRDLAPSANGGPAPK